MSEVLVPIIVVPVIFFAIVMVVKTISDNAVRKKIIDKGLVNEEVKYLFAREHADYLPVSLKWGMVLVALGLAILIGRLVPYSFQDEATVSGMFILGGLALILYYLVTRGQQRDDRQE